jgi:hypothetical protein
VAKNRLWIRSPIAIHTICARILAAIVENPRSNNSPVPKARVEHIDRDRRHVAASVGRIFISESGAVVSRGTVFTGIGRPIAIIAITESPSVCRGSQPPDEPECSDRC